MDRAKYNNYNNSKENIEKGKYIFESYNISKSQHFMEFHKKNENFTREPLTISTNRCTKLSSKPKSSYSFKPSYSFKESTKGKTLIGNTYNQIVRTNYGIIENETNDILLPSIKCIERNNSQYNNFHNHVDNTSSKRKHFKNIKVNTNKGWENENSIKQIGKEWVKQRDMKKEHKRDQEKDQKQDQKQNQKQNQERYYEEEEIKKDTREIKNWKREDVGTLKDEATEQSNRVDETNRREEEKEENIFLHNFVNFKKRNLENQNAASNYKCNDHLFLNEKKSVPFEKEDNITLEDLYFDIHMDDKKEEKEKQEIEKEKHKQKEKEKEKEKDYKSFLDNFKRNENEDKQIILDHIKRLENQNEIFLNNLLNMYYVCTDYMKMQDNKIKEKEQIIKKLEEEIKQKDKIINRLQKKDVNFDRSFFCKKMNT